MPHAPDWLPDLIGSAPVAALAEALRAPGTVTEYATRLARALALLASDPDAEAAPIASSLDAAYRYVRAVETARASRRE